MRKRITILALCALLAGCGAASGASAGACSGLPPVRSSEPVAQTSPSADAPRVEYMGSSSDGSGYYALLAHFDGTGNLIRYDYETMRCTFLSGETDPRNANSPAFLPSVVGDPWLLVGSRHLYVLKGPVPAQLLDDAYKAQGHGFLMRMEPDGSGRKTLPLPDDVGVVYENSAVLEGEKLLLVLCQQGEGGAQAWYLAEADFAAGTIRQRLEFEEGTTAHLCGACARGPILGLRKVGEAQRFVLCDLGANVLEPIPFSGDDAPWCLDGRTGVVYYPEGDNVYSYDVATGRREATAARLPDGWAQARFENVVDGYLLLSRGKQGEKDYDRIAFCLATGEVFRPTLKDSGQRVTIAAVTPRGYLVSLAGLKVRYRDRVSGSSGRERNVSHYVMMDAADYWNNRPVYREFDNPAYEYCFVNE